MWSDPIAVIPLPELGVPNSTVSRMGGRHATRLNAVPSIISVRTAKGTRPATTTGTRLRNNFEKEQNSRSEKIIVSTRTFVLRIKESGSNYQIFEKRWPLQIPVEGIWTLRSSTLASAVEGLNLHLILRPRLHTASLEYRSLVESHRVS